MCAFLSASKVAFVTRLCRPRRVKSSPGHVVKEQVEAVVFLRDTAPGKFIGVWCGVGAVDRFAVGFHPFANGEKAIDTGHGHTAVGVRPDVEQVVDAFAGEFNEKVEQCFHAFPVVVIGFVAPGIVEGGGCFPVAFEATGGDLIVAQAAVIPHAIAHATAYEAVGLQAVDEAGEGLALFQGNRDGGVEPYQADRSVLREQLAHLGFGFVFEIIGEVFGRGVKIPVVTRGVGVVPVLILRIVEAEANAVFLTGFGEVCHNIFAVRRGIDNVVVAARGVIHGKAVVVLAVITRYFMPASRASLATASASNFTGLNCEASCSYSAAGISARA